MDEEIIVYLENETTQKFNTWLEDCFEKLSDFYYRRARESGVVYKFHKPVINGGETGSYILAAYNIGHRIERGIILKWIEVGARLKVIIAFPSDPKIINPVWNILFGLYNDFPDTQRTVLDILRKLKSKYQLEDSLPPLPKPQVNTAETDGNALLAQEMRIARTRARLDRTLRSHGFTIFPDEHVNAAQVDAVETEKPNGKLPKPKRKKPTMPKRKADAYKWVLAWELIDPKIKDDPTLKIDYDELREYLKAHALPFKGNDTLSKIIQLGRVKKIPSREDFERINNM